MWSTLRPATLLAHLFCVVQSEHSCNTLLYRGARLIRQQGGGRGSRGGGGGWGRGGRDGGGRSRGGGPDWHDRRPAEPTAETLAMMGG